ncbi:MAG: MBL fold metallo-hydrolase [Luteitalea sp.]|nr:MBL fold metallo-hydrolase [Luteitalea sp.]
MRVRFWGVRGSVPWATPGSIGYGCNTPCIEVSDSQAGAFLIIDAGSGIVGLGEALGGSPRPVPILLSHFHWDHIQGIPFFAPLHRPGWSPAIWAPALADAHSLSLDSMFTSPFFPVPRDRLASPPLVTLIQPGQIEVGGFRVSAHRVTHPGGAFAYRVHGDGNDVVYATDHEFGDIAVDEQLAAFALNADAIVVDAHFTPEELLSHQGWGHSSWKQAADFASAAGAGHLWLFHHKPGRPDAELAEVERRARRVFPATTVAREGAAFGT